MSAAPDDRLEHSICPVPDSAYSTTTAIEVRLGIAQKASRYTWHLKIESVRSDPGQGTYAIRVRPIDCSAIENFQLSQRSSEQSRLAITLITAGWLPAYRGGIKLHALQFEVYSAPG